MSGALEIQLDSMVPVADANVLLHRQNDVLNYVHGTMGIPQLTKPGRTIATLPEDLTTLSDDQLGDLLSVLGQWVGYIDQQLANTDGQRKSADAYLTFIQARARIEIKQRSTEKRMTTQDKNDMMETSPTVLDAKDKAMFWESTYRLTKSLRDSVQLAWETVSRRITQRGQEVDRMRRENNVAGIPSAVRTFRRPGES
jgi:hypothetical protein